MRAGPELIQHFRVHGDHRIVLVGHVSIAGLDLLLHPLAERHADDGRADVDDPLLGTLGEVLVVGQIRLDLRMCAGEGTDMLERKILVLRDEDRLDAVGLEVPLLHHDNVLEL